MKKKVSWFRRSVTVVVVLVLVVALLVGTLPLWVDPVMRNMVEKNAPALIGAPVSMEKIHLNPFTGKLNIKGIRVGNPMEERFSDNDMFTLDTMVVHLKALSLIGGQDKPIVIHKILIDNPQILYETSLRRASNVDTLKARMTAADKKEQVRPVEKSAKEPRKVIIEAFTFTGGTLRYRQNSLGGATIPVPLPAFTLTNIGKKSGGATAAEAVGSIFGGIGDSIAEAVKSIGSSIGDLFKSSDK